MPTLKVLPDDEYRRIRQLLNYYQVVLVPQSFVNQIQNQVTSADLENLDLNFGYDSADSEVLFFDSVDEFGEGIIQDALDARRARKNYQ